MFKKVLVAIAATAMVASATPVLNYIGVPGVNREANLQEILDSAAFDKKNDVNVLTDEIKDDRFWSIGSSRLGNATILIEIAGNKDLNTFGLYDVNDPANKMEIFSGGDSQGKKVILSYYEGVIYLGEQQGPNPTNFVGVDQITTPNYFGFYMGHEGNSKDFFYSDYAKNGGNDQMVTYQGKGEYVKWPGQTDYASWGAGEYVLAWEDVSFPSSDKDYNDMVILVESIYPIPEPTMIGLLGLGLIGLVAYRRKK